MGLAVEMLHHSLYTKKGINTNLSSQDYKMIFFVVTFNACLNMGPCLAEKICDDLRNSL
jgi:hypothetical protein